MNNSPQFDRSHSIYKLINAHLDIMAEALLLVAHREAPRLKEMLQRKRAEAEEAIFELAPFAQPHDISHDGILSSGSTRLLDLLPVPGERAAREVAHLDIQMSDFVFAAGPAFIDKALEYYALEASLIGEIIPLCYRDPEWLPVLEKISLTPLVLDITDRLSIWHFTAQGHGFRHTMSAYPEVAAPLLRHQISADPEIGAELAQSVLRHRNADNDKKIAALRQLRACGAEFDNTSLQFKGFVASLTNHQAVAIYTPCSKTAAHAAKDWVEVGRTLKEKLNFQAA